LPVVFIDRRQRIDDRGEKVVGNHFRIRVGADAGSGPFAGINRPPQVEHGEQRNEPEERPRQEIEPVRQIVLNADREDVAVLFHRAPLPEKIRSRGAGLAEKLLRIILFRWRHPSAAIEHGKCICDVRAGFYTVNRDETKS
jgi:hypothetical protein